MALRRAVTDAETDEFWSLGVVCLRGILPLDFVLDMAGAVDRVLDTDGVTDLGSLTGTPASAPFRAGVDHWHVDPDFRAFSTSPLLGSVASRLLRSRVVSLWEDSVLVKEPGSPHVTTFHSDAGYFHVRGEQVCTTWIPLDPVTSENGALAYVAGSHLDGREYRPNLFVTDDPLPGTVGPTVPVESELRDRLVSYDLEPGDMTVHHYRTIHGATANRSTDQRRRAISVRFCGDDARYQHKPGLPSRPGLDEVADGDPVGPPWCPIVWPPT